MMMMYVSLRSVAFCLGYELLFGWSTGTGSLLPVVSLFQLRVNHEVVVVVVNI
jgi:hypothetical protein